MVAKARTISYGMAKLEYDANKTIGGEHVASETCRHNLYGETPGEITREMHDVQENHHRNLSKCYFDIVITLSESDAEAVQTVDEHRQLVEEYMHRLMVMQQGLSEEQFSGMQWIAYRHGRTDHNKNLCHWHVLANRVLRDGTVTSDSFIGKKAAKVANDISRERGFSVAEDISTENREEIRVAALKVLQGMTSYSFDVFKVMMAAEGYEVREAFSKSGNLQGYYILSKSGTQYKASAIDRSLTLGRIEKKWQGMHTVKLKPSLKPHRSSSAHRSEGKRSCVFMDSNHVKYIVNPPGAQCQSRNRENEVGSKHSPYDDDYEEERSKGYSM